MRQLQGDVFAFQPPCVVATYACFLVVLNRPLSRVFLSVYGSHMPAVLLLQALPAVSRPLVDTGLVQHAPPTSAPLMVSNTNNDVTHQVKRQKVEEAEPRDSKAAGQEVQEARSVAAATKQQLGLTGN